ncbi:NADP-dependent oxidoreductase domain-containing protein [Polychytrium aggregatum]|uniref:NADP-dependent oxidoreductase domain-containing protein n=1 Tax=Polychytrium aggregatum TaxID=110093 RepID=UPI0022FDFE0F|nr:NADP-dependent oxidoreductase domain-containing protein [Polychytrium aggregatum]KAI9204529.1 NADP-dependent oxidoreductase domain-containing protein [Polychytrium aggregatum]
MSLQRTFKLANGHAIPAIGLGTWQSKPNEVFEAVKTAIQVGYRHIDGAAIYGNEKEVGDAIAQAGAARESLFVTSKLWNDSHHPQKVHQALDKTLSDLKLSYLDLYLVHWPLPFLVDESGKPVRNKESGAIELDTSFTFQDTWRELERAVEEGKVRSIGVSNFNVRRLKELLAFARIKPVVNQVELHPYLPQNELFEFAKANDILLTAYSPLGSGGSPNILEDEVIAQVAKKHGKTSAQTLISWAAQRGTSVIPKSVNPERIKANFEDFILDEADIEAINKLHLTKAKRYVDPKPFFGVDVFEN